MARYTLDEAAEMWLEARARRGSTTNQEDEILEDALWEARREERRDARSMAAPADAPDVRWLCPMFD